MTTPAHVDRHGTACTVCNIPACDGSDACPYPVRVIISEEHNGTSSTTWVWITMLP